MSANLNKVMLIGNLTRDPELRKMPSGATVTNFGLAINRSYKTPEGELKEEVCFVDVAVMNRSAEACGKYLSKGSPVMVEGRLRLERWEAKNGEKRNRLTVVGENVQFLSSSRSRTGEESGAAAPPEPAAAEVSSAPAAREEAVQDSGAPQGGDSDNLPF